MRRNITIASRLIDALREFAERLERHEPIPATRVKINRKTGKVSHKKVLLRRKRK